MTQQLLTATKKEIPATCFSTADDLPNVPMHLLPCKIEHDGRAPVTEYFIQEQTEDPGVLRTSFRGRELLGSTVTLPQGYTGYVGTKTGSNIELTNSFHEFTFWNREVKPSTRDPVHNWMQWPGIAAAIYTNTPPQGIPDEEIA